MSAAPGRAQGATRVTLSPLAMELYGERGASVPFSIHITNESPLQTARFEVYAMGLGEGRNGDYSPIPPGESVYDASSWIRFEKDSFEIRAGASYELQGTVMIPRDAGASGYASVVMELLPEERVGEAELSIEFTQRFVTALEIVIGNRHVRSAHIDSMTVIPASTVPEFAAAYGNRAVIFIGSLLNDGNVHVIGRGSLTIRDERGRLVRQVPLGAGRGVVLPETVVDFVSVLGGLAPGKYDMQAVIDYGGSRPAVGRMEFELTDEAVGVSRIVAGRAVRIDADPTLLTYELPRLGYRAQTITVMNRDNVDVEFNVTLEELANDEGGEPITVEPGVVMPYSAVAWGEVRPATFTLRPGQRRNVVVSFRVPDGEVGGRYARVRIQGSTPPPQPAMSAASSEILADALLVVGNGFAPHMDIAEVDWRPVGDMEGLAVGATVFNAGDIHGSADLRLTLLQLAPETEEQVGDIVLVKTEQWNIVDAVRIGQEAPVLLPGEARFMFGTFEHALQPGHQYRVVVESVGDEGERIATTTLNVWRDEAGVIHEGLLDAAVGVDD